MKADRRKIEIAMARACLTTDDLAKKAKMPKPTVYNIITGRNVKAITLGKIAKALECDVVELLPEKEEEKA